MIKSEMVGTDTIRECPVFSRSAFDNTKVKLWAKAATEVFLCAFQHITAGAHDVTMSHYR